MANIIIGIHGLGNKPSKRILERWWKRSIKEGLRANNYKSKLPRFEMVYWADITHPYPLSIREKNPKSPFYLEEKYVKAKKYFPLENFATRIKFRDFLDHQLTRIFLNDDYSLNYSFITDALIRKYFKDLELYYREEFYIEVDTTRKVRELIRERLLNTLIKYKDDDIMLISHSMGSIIAFDVLTFLAHDLEINTFVTMGSPLGLPVVISKIAAEQKRMLNGENHMITPLSIDNKWYNFSDILDNVAFNYKLSDDFSANAKGIIPTDFLVINNYEINYERNHHKSFGYLRTPEFSKVLNEFITSEKLSVFQKIAKKTSGLIHKLKSQKIDWNDSGFKNEEG